MNDDKVAMHKELCEFLNDLYERKNRDYGDSFGKSIERFGLIASLVRIEDKFNRAVNLARGAVPHVADEKIEDTLLDMANYAIMTVIEMRVGAAK